MKGRERWSSSGPDGEFYFLEVNARVQVEHPVTEMVTGIDIVKEQIRIASGLPLSVGQEDVRMQRLRHRVPHQRRGSSRTASPPRPAGSRATILPGGPGVRVDSGVYSSYTIPPFYDPLMRS